MATTGSFSTGVTLRYINGADQETITSARSKSVTYSVDRIGVSTMIVTDTPVTINKGNITTLGYIYVSNIDTTGSLQIGPDGVNWPIFIQPTESTLFRSNQWTDVYVSGSGTTLINYALYPYV
jgi:hypothetical protein